MKDIRSLFAVLQEILSRSVWEMVRMALFGWAILLAFVTAEASSKPQRGGVVSGGVVVGDLGLDRELFDKVGDLIRDGYISTHGGKVKTDEENVWFLGREKIPLCVLRADDFPLSEPELRSLIHEAFVEWRSFFAKYKMDDVQLDGFSDGKSRGMTLEIEISESCSHPRKELLFLFGSTFGEMSLPEGIDHALGLAMRWPYDHKEYRSGGIIWVKGWTSDRVKIKHILLHEVGHVFGMKHNSTFVMDAKIADRLLHVSDGEFGKIESVHWPYTLERGSEVDMSYTFECQGVKGFTINSSLPKEILEKLELDRNGCFRLGLKYVSRRGLSNQKLQLTISTLEGKSFEFSGSFTSHLRAATKSTKGPSLYTQWRVFGRDDLLISTTKNFDTSAYLFPLQGQFESSVRGEKVKFPAIVEMNRGPSISMFLSDSAKWWNGLFPVGLEKF